jgi:hypothetical protein
MEFENTEHITKIEKPEEVTINVPNTPAPAPITAPTIQQAAPAPIIAKRTRAKASPTDKRKLNTGRPYISGDKKVVIALNEKQAQIIELIIARRGRGEDIKGLLFALLRYALKGTILERFETNVSNEEIKNLLS